MSPTNDKEALSMILHKYCYLNNMNRYNNSLANVERENSIPQQKIYKQLQNAESGGISIPNG